MSPWPAKLAMNGLVNAQGNELLSHVMTDWEPLNDRRSRRKSELTFRVASSSPAVPAIIGYQLAKIGVLPGETCTDWLCVRTGRLILLSSDLETCIDWLYVRTGRLILLASDL